MKLALLILLSVLPILLVSCSRPQACTAEAKICPDGTSVGRTGLNCGFAQCPIPKAVMCTPEQAKANYCMELFDPVCGNDQKTYGNSCFACQAGIKSWTPGACPKQ